MKALLLLLCLCAQSYGASLTLAWDQSPDPTVVGYKLYYGVAAGVYTNSINVDKSQLTNRVHGLLANVRYYFAVASYDKYSDESNFSNEINAIPTELPPPLLFLNIPIAKAPNATSAFVPWTNLVVSVPNTESNAIFQFDLSISGKFTKPQGIPGFVVPKTKALRPPLPPK